MKTQRHMEKCYTTVLVDIRGRGKPRDPRIEGHCQKLGRVWKRPYPESQREYNPTGTMGLDFLFSELLENMFMLF